MRGLREARVAGLQVEADEQAGCLALRDRGEPGRVDQVGVRHREEVPPAAVLRAALVLGLEQVLAGREGRVQPLLALAADVALVRAQAPLDRRDVELLAARRQPLGGPLGDSALKLKSM